MCWWTSEIARGERAVANRVIVSGLVGRTSPYQPIQLPTNSTLYTQNTRDKLIAIRSRPGTLLLLTLKTLKCKSLLPKSTRNT